MDVRQAGNIAPENLSPGKLADPGLASVTGPGSAWPRQTREVQKMLSILTETQRAILEAAAQREDRLLPLLSNLKGGAARAVATKLAAAGLARQVKAVKDAPVWRREEASGRALALKLTAAGKKALSTTGGEPQPLNEPPKAAATRQARDGRARARSRPVADPVALPEQALARNASADHAGTALPDENDGANDASNKANAVALRAPRRGSKLDRILALLSSQTGATLAELIEATGWLPHSARAALTGLRKRGYDLRLARRERVGASVYRILATAAASLK
jgi:hypothetical protein